MCASLAGGYSPDGSSLLHCLLIVQNLFKSPKDESLPVPEPPNMIKALSPNATHVWESLALGASDLILSHWYNGISFYVSMSICGVGVKDKVQL